MGIESNTIFNRNKSGCRVGIVPGGIRYLLVPDGNCIIAGSTFPLTEGLPRGWLQVLHLDVWRRNVINWRVARFQDAVAAAAVGDGDAIENNLHLFRRSFEARGAGVIPDRFLTGLGYDWLWSQHDTNEATIGIFPVLALPLLLKLDGEAGGGGDTR